MNNQMAQSTSNNADRSGGLSDGLSTDLQSDEMISRLFAGL
eukprot:gene5198-26192_t